MASLFMVSVTYSQSQTKTIKEKIPERNSPCFNLYDSMRSKKEFLVVLLQSGKDVTFLHLGYPQYMYQVIVT